MKEEKRGLKTISVSVRSFQGRIRATKDYYFLKLLIEISDFHPVLRLESQEAVAPPPVRGNQRPKNNGGD